jgi:hypothetical protein
MAVPYTFGSATTSIPLSQLDSNFATAITLGNTAIQLGNTVTTLNNMTLANATVSSGNATVTTLTAPTHNSASSLTFQTNGTTTAITVDTSQNVLVGTTTTTNNLRNGEKVAVVTTGGNQGGASLTTYSGTGAGNGVILDIQRSRGTTDGSMTAVASGDTLGYILFRGSDGTSFQDSSYITAQVDGAVSGGTVPGRLGFITSGTERMRLNSSGTVILQGGSTSATGVGIAFPATQSASSDANTLDDYEEGTFTPTIIGKTSAGTGTYSNQTGSYIKVGQMVSIFIRMDWSAHTGTGNMGFGGLPFTSAGTFANGAAVNGMAGMTVTASCYVAANVDSSSTTGSFLAIPVGGGNDSPLAMDVSAILLFTITYRASA